MHRWRFLYELICPAFAEKLYSVFSEKLCRYAVTVNDGVGKRAVIYPPAAAGRAELLEQCFLAAVRLCLFKREVRAAYVFLCDISALDVYDLISDAFGGRARGAETSVDLGTDREKLIPFFKLFQSIIRKDIASAAVFTFRTVQAGTDYELFHVIS